MNSIPLNLLRIQPDLRAVWSGKLVYIWDEKYRMYWRAEARGYTPRITDGVGVFDFEEAYRQTAHCEPERMIEFEEAK